MNQARALKRWASTAEPQVFGVELAEPWDRTDNLLADLESSLRQADGSAARFVVCPVLEHEDLARSLLTLPSRFRGVRICVAVPATVLPRLERDTLDRLRVGLLLDGVTLDTSLRALCASALEAVRFDASFLASAAGDVRVRCALESLAGLAADLGLVTLGSHPSGDVGEPHVGGLRPDYVPATALVSDVLRHPASLLRH